MRAATRHWNVACGKGTNATTDDGRSRPLPRLPCLLPFDPDRVLCRLGRSVSSMTSIGFADSRLFGDDLTWPTSGEDFIVSHWIDSRNAAGAAGNDALLQCNGLERFLGVWSPKAGRNVCGE